MSKSRNEEEPTRDNEDAVPTASYGDAGIGPGAIIGPYKLLRILGEGGYGIVYLAEQQRPVRRRVALKVIKPGMDSKQVIARFEAERQALALLDHPNIAHVFNAGTTEAGRPYFAMEYVKGVPITEHCDTHKLTIEERLHLFLAVCEAVQHAHQKAIIHRDIKPSNILVSYEGKQAVPMIIDFGVAKALSQPLTERTLVTEQAQIVGTPEYMSPEQADMTGQDIDTRTDIYSLGVLCYKLLTGALPFDSQTLREGGIDRMRQMIRDQEPRPPSTRVSDIAGDESVNLANQRRTDIRTLGRRLRGELDWITLKAMEKDRARRYQTAHALAEDIERYLNQQPVLAGPPSTVYILQKFIRRNKTLFVSAATIAATLIVAVIFSSYQAWSVSKARNIAEQERNRSQSNLYDSLVREARATRIARRVGYRDEVFSAIQQARDLDVPQNDLLDLRNEAIACLGDFVGLSPKLVSETSDGSPTITRARLHPTEMLAALALQDGTIFMKDLHSGRDVARFDGEYPVHALRFSAAGNTLVSLHAPQSSSYANQYSDAMVRSFERTDAGAWIQGESKGIPNSRLCLRVGRGFYVYVVDEASHLLRIVDFASGNVIHQHEYPQEMDTAPMIGITEDGRFLAVAIVDTENSNSSVIEIWDLNLGSRIERLETGLSKCANIRFSPDGQHLGFLSLSGAIIYETVGFKPVGQMVEPFNPGANLEFLPNSTIIAINMPGGQMHLRDWKKQSVVLTIDLLTGSGRYCSVSADGQSILTYRPRDAWLYTLDVSGERMTLSGHSGGVPQVVFSPDGSHLASVGKDRRLRVWDTTTGDLDWERPLDGRGQSVAYNADGSWLATGTMDSGRVRIWSTKTTEQLFEAGGNDDIETWMTQFTDDDRYIVVGTRDPEPEQGALTAWSIMTTDSGGGAQKFEAKQVKSLPGDITEFMFSPDYKYVAFVSRGRWRYNQGLYLWEFMKAASPKVLANDVFGWAARIIEFAPNGREIIALDPNRLVVAYDVDTGQKKPLFPTLEEEYANSPSMSVDLSLSPDGTRLAIKAPSLYAVDLWHLESRNLLYTLPDQEGNIYWLEWSPDGRRLAVSRSNGAIDIWNIAEIDRVLSDLGLSP